MIDPSEVNAARSRTEAAADGQGPPVVRLPDAALDPEPPSPVAAVLTRRPGSIGMLARDQDGSQVWPPAPAPPPLPEEPDYPVDEIAVDASGYATSEAVLLAEGWQPPRPDLHEVLLQREALRLAWSSIRARAAQDFGLVGAAIRRADVDGIVAAAATNGLDMWLSANGGQDSPLHAYSYDLELRRVAMIWQHADSILRTLAGRHSQAAERLRADCLASQRLPAPPTSIGLTTWLLR